MGGLKEKGGRARVEVWGSETLSLHVQNICAAEREREKKKKKKRSDLHLNPFLVTHFSKESGGSSGSRHIISL